jgi:hypothetical protein
MLLQFITLVGTTSPCLIITTRLLQQLVACTLIDNLRQAVQTQLVGGLLADFVQEVKF